MSPRKPGVFRRRRLRRETSITATGPKLRRHRAKVRDRVLAQMTKHPSAKPSRLPLIERLRARRAMQGNQTPRKPLFRSRGERVVAAVVGCAVAAVGITYGLSRIPAPLGNAQPEILEANPVVSPSGPATPPSPTTRATPSRVPSPSPDPGPQSTP